MQQDLKFHLSKWLEALRKRCDEVGALLIFDEIQTGFGRTGQLFAIDTFGVTPDILCIAKGMGGGMPIGCFISSKENMDKLKDNPKLGHITTFGGHPVCCAASLATLTTLIEDKNIIQSVERKEQIFRENLQHPKIKEVRGKGLMLAIELDDAKLCQYLVEKGYEHGLIMFFFLFTNTAVRLSPPLIISEEEIIKACNTNQKHFKQNIDMKNILFLATIFAFSIACGTNEDNRGYKVKVGDSCPDFSMELLDGTTITNESLLGKVSVIQFTASWCGVCRKEMPHLETQVWQEFKDEDFILLGVDLKESKEKTTTFIEEMQVTYPIALDTNGQVFEQFTLPKAGVTRNIVLDRKGKIIFLTRLFDKVEFHQMIEVIRKELEQ